MTRRCPVEHRELLEQHEGRLRLYVRLLQGLEESPSGAETRQTVLDLVRREVRATDRIAAVHMRHLTGEEQREAFRYAMTFLLPYYTHLARIYGSRSRVRMGSVAPETVH